MPSVFHFYTIRCRSCSHTVNYFNLSGNDASSNLNDIRNWEVISEMWNFNFYSTSIASATKSGFNCTSNIIHPQSDG